MYNMLEPYERPQVWHMLFQNYYQTHRMDFMFMQYENIAALITEAYQC